jgi:transcriptional regulator with XRE-family HTH domain
MDDWKAIGARIKQARAAKRLTQVDLAVAIGVSRAHLTNAEGGNGGLALDKLSALARETGTTVGWLIGEAGPVDHEEALLLTAFRALEQRDRGPAVRVVQSLRRDDPPVAIAPKRIGPDPPRPTAGGNVKENQARETPVLPRPQPSGETALRRVGSGRT